MHFPPNSHGRGVLGAVRARGRLEVYAHGFRAEFAEPIALSVTEVRMQSLACKAAHRYGVPLVPLERLGEFVHEHGALVPLDMRPMSSHESCLLDGAFAFILAEEARHDEVEALIASHHIRVTSADLRDRVESLREIYAWVTRSGWRSEMDVFPNLRFKLLRGHLHDFYRLDYVRRRQILLFLAFGLGDLSCEAERIRTSPTADRRPRHGSRIGTRRTSVAASR